MATEKQNNANRQNAQHSTGPRTEAGRRKVRFNACTHGLYAKSAVLPGEDQQEFNSLRDTLVAGLNPVDDHEKSLCERIAVDQWKLARLDRNEAGLYESDPKNQNDFVKSLNTYYLIQNRLERAISNLYRDLERYRLIRLERLKDADGVKLVTYSPGLIERDDDGRPYFDVPPHIRGLDGKWRGIPREIVGDFCGRPSDSYGPIRPEGPTEPLPGWDSPEDCPDEE